jgi:periplasmic divalent cation tolerance protein
VDLRASAVVLTTTLDDLTVASSLATSAVELRLAACAQIVGPVTSVYRWQGAIERATEWQVVLKTAVDRADALRAHIAATHPYEVPEIIVTPIVGGSPAYLDWLVSESRDPGTAPPEPR